jgi:uncharacterized protein (TIGR02996 family)
VTTVSDEAALWRAIEAAPLDDAPWLVYADWLDDHGRDREAANLRRLLPDAQTAVYLNGESPNAVMGQLARLDIVDGWGLPMPAAPARALPPAPPPGPYEFAPRRSRGSQILMWFLFAGIIAVVRIAVHVAQDAAEKAPPAAQLFDPSWHASDVAGHTFYLDSDSEVLVLGMAENRVAQVTMGKKGDAPTQVPGRWSIQPNGPLQVRSSDGSLICELQLKGVRFDVYTVIRAGRTEIFTRDWPRRPNSQ